MAPSSIQAAIMVRAPRWLQCSYTYCGEDPQQQEEEDLHNADDGGNGGYYTLLVIFVLFALVLSGVVFAFYPKLLHYRAQWQQKQAETKLLRHRREFLHRSLVTEKIRITKSSSSKSQKQRNKKRVKDVETGTGHTQEEEERAECLICMQAFRKGDTVAWSKSGTCRHAYHKDCIIEWLLADHTECPYCRQVMVPDTTKSSADDLETMLAAAAAAAQDKNKRRSAGRFSFTQGVVLSDDDDVSCCAKGLEMESTDETNNTISKPSSLPNDDAERASSEPAIELANADSSNQAASMKATDALARKEELVLQEA